MVRTYIRGKLCKSIGIICKARTLLNKSTLVTLYNSFEFPYISYCIEVWGNTFDKYLLPLYVTCHIKTSPMSQDIENELVSGAQVSNAPKIINISQLFRKSSMKQDLAT